ncbi:MAG: hypothetical protein WCD34_08290 [Candidatus Acidiferrum sp.]
MFVSRHGGALELYDPAPDGVANQAGRASPGVDDLLLAHILPIGLFQSVEDDRG